MKILLNVLPIKMVPKVVNQAGVPTEYPLFALAEAIYMSWFTFEFLVRMYFQNYVYN